MRDAKTYELLADALSYPGEFYGEILRSTSEQLKGSSPEIEAAFDRFARELGTKTLEELEEIYTGTFDIQALCYLEIGYVLFGEDYKRGAFLVELNRLHREHSHSTEGELADYLPAVLRLLTKMKDAGERRALMDEAVLPALDKMLGYFGDPPEVDDKEDKRDKEFVSHLKPKKNFIYRELLETLRGVLRADSRDELKRKSEFHA